MLTDIKIQYKWLFPEDLNFVWEGKPIRLDSIYKGQRFAIDNAQKLDYRWKETKTQPGEVHQSTSQQTATGGCPKVPRSLRQRTVVKKIEIINHGAL